MVNKECAEEIRKFTTAVNPTLTDEQVKDIADLTVLKECSTQFKKIFIDDGIKDFTPGTREVLSQLVEHPEYLRPNSYLEFGNNIMIEADGEKDANGRTENIFHSVITSRPESPLTPSCGRVDTRAKDVSDIVQYQLDTTPEVCLNYLKEISK